MKCFDANWIQNQGVKLRAIKKQEDKDIALGLSVLQIPKLISRNEMLI